MKDAYKNKLNDLISSLDQRLRIVYEMTIGERPADHALAEKYLREAKKGLENIQEIVDIS
jgi:hypothetical protein